MLILVWRRKIWQLWKLPFFFTSNIPIYGLRPGECKNFHDITILNGFDMKQYIRALWSMSFFIRFVIHSLTFYLMVFMSIECNQRFTVQIKVLISSFSVRETKECELYLVRLSFTFSSKWVNFVCFLFFHFFLGNIVSFIYSMTKLNEKRALMKWTVALK